MSGKDRLPSAAAMLCRVLKIHEPETVRTVSLILAAIVDQAVEEARNERKGLDGDNRRPQRNMT